MNHTTVFREWLHRFANPARRDSASGGSAGRLGLVTMVGVTLVLFWVHGYRPLVGEPWQWADDGLYLRQSEAVLRWLHGDGTQWLGPYDAQILAKAPLFAIWMAALNTAHLPLRLAEFGLLASLPWLFRAAVRPVLALSWWQFAITGSLLIALPFLPQEQRLLRDVLQAALSSGCLIAGVGLLLRARHSDRRMGLWAASTGLLFALAYLNHEETVWLIPTMLCQVVATVTLAWRSRPWSHRLTASAYLFGAAVVPIALISGLNYRSYGVFVTTTRRAPEFTRAHQLMASLEPDTRQRYVPIRTETRLKAYAVSPTFARMRSYLEGPATDPIARHPEQLSASGLPPTTREFVVSDFQFVLQELRSRQVPGRPVILRRCSVPLHASCSRPSRLVGLAPVGVVRQHWRRPFPETTAA